MPLGNTALQAVLGLEGIQDRRGYLYYSDRYPGLPIIPTVHPSFILRGNQPWCGAWIRDVGLGVQVALGQRPASPRRELAIDIPNIYSWQAQWSTRGHPFMAVDIETLRWADEEHESEGPLTRIGFAYRWQGTTYALSIPWSTACAGLTTCLLKHGALVWNRHFDFPRLREKGVEIGHPQHDVQEMWHLFQPDLPKKLAFAGCWLVPGQPYWKDLHKEQPGYYNAVDAAVTAEGYEVLYG